MIRLVGFVTGSGLAVALILLVLGMPELHTQEPAPMIIPYEPPMVSAASDPEPQPRPEPATEPANVPEPESEPEPVPQPLQAPAPEAEPAFVAQLTDQNSTPPQWYSFWSPFRSQIAANGFVSRLESVTGFDYRVVKVDAGVYEVAFAYGDDTEREQKLSTIAAATGLELPES